MLWVQYFFFHLGHPSDSPAFYLFNACFLLQSECLKEAFSELDMTSEVLQILMSPDNPYFRLSTFGHAGSTHVRFLSSVVRTVLRI